MHEYRGRTGCGSFVCSLGEAMSISKCPLHTSKTDKVVIFLLFISDLMLLHVSGRVGEKSAQPMLFQHVGQS